MPILPISGRNPLAVMQQRGLGNGAGNGRFVDLPICRFAELFAVHAGVWIDPYPGGSLRWWMVAPLIMGSAPIAQSPAGTP